MIIKQEILPVGHKARPGRKMAPKYVTVHNTGNSNKGANARGHSDYAHSGQGGTTGWHFVVDDTEVIQNVPTNETAYHAGDGAGGPGNTTSIAVEICENVDGDMAKAVANAIELIRQLMGEFNILLANVVPHQKWSGKYCPRQILPRWNEFVALVGNVGGTYTVKSGDTLGAIAGRNGLTLAELLGLNPHITNPNAIAVGMQLAVVKLEPPMPEPQPEPLKPDPMASVPEYARGAILKAHRMGYINEPLGDETFYRLLVLMDRLELLK